MLLWIKVLGLAADKHREEEKEKERGEERGMLNEAGVAKWAGAAKTLAPDSPLAKRCIKRFFVRCKFSVGTFYLPTRI